MQPEMIIAKIEGIKQASLLNSMAGKSFTVVKANLADTGLGTWLFLNPAEGAASAQAPIAVKLEGTRQAAELSGLVGKSVTIGKAPMVAGTGVGKWLVLYPSASGGAQGAMATGVAAKGFAPSMMKTIAMTGAPGAAATTGKAFAAGAAAKTATAGGMSLGLGLGLGSLGPVLLACLAGAASYGAYKWYRNRGTSAAPDEIVETLQSH